MIEEERRWPALSIAIGQNTKKISYQGKAFASKNVDKFFRYPVNLFPSESPSPWTTLLPGTPAAVNKVVL